MSNHISCPTATLCGSGWVDATETPHQQREYASCGECIDMYDFDHPAETDMVNAPAHYTVGGIETIDFIEAKGLNYHLANAVKYITRAEHKGKFDEDISKAIWYLTRERDRRRRSS